MSSSNIGGPQQIYALIKLSSKYAGQDSGVPFRAQFIVSSDDFVILGNCNRYRLRDVWLYVRLVNGDFIRINGSGLSHEYFKFPATINRDGSRSS